MQRAAAAYFLSTAGKGNWPIRPWQSLVDPWHGGCKSSGCKLGCKLGGNLGRALPSSVISAHETRGERPVSNKADPGLERRATIVGMAKIIGLEIGDAHCDGVVANFNRIEAIASLVTTFPLPDDVEIAVNFAP